MIRRWYLVQFDLEASNALDINCAVTGLYYCYFLAKHPSDINKSDESSWWWPDWYRYTRDSITNNIIFGDRILLRPNLSPDPKKFIQWGDSVNLLDKECMILGPFDFKMISHLNRTCCKIDANEWQQLSNICSHRGILGPTICPNLRFNPNPSTQKKRKR